MVRLLMLSLMTVLAAPAVERFVSLVGSSENAGTFNRPWDLQTALSNAAPGDTVWLRGGLYRGNFTCSASGTREQPIVFRAYPGERARIDGGSSQYPALSIGCNYAWFWGLEIFFSDAKRKSSESGSNPTDIHRGIGLATVQSPNTCIGLKFINLVLHDNFESIGLWAEAVDAEVYGSIIYHDGWDAPDRGHGHGIYTQNAAAGTKRIEDNIMFGSFSHGLHVYSFSDLMQNFHIEGNVAFNNGRLASDTESTNYRVSGEMPPKNIVFKNNHSYFSPEIAGGDVVLGSNNGCTNLTVTGNYFIALKGRALVKPSACRDITLQRNVFLGATVGVSRTGFPDNAYLTEVPKGVETFIRPNRYEQGRAHIVIYNWDRADTVPVDVSAILRKGDYFELRDAQNPLGEPVLKGIYESLPLSLPMRSAVIASPIGELPVSAVHTGPEFGVFVLTAPKRALVPRAAPEIAPQGVRNAASMSDTIAPGSLISVFGSNLALYTEASTTQPLPESLGGSTFTINGSGAPLLYADPYQINAQVPYDVPAGRTVAVVTVGDLTSEPAEFSIEAAAPGIFQIDGGRAAALNADWSLNSPERPARPGDMIAAYCTGLGVPDRPMAPGIGPADPVPIQPPASATIGSSAAPVLYSGLAPRFVGLCQVNLLVPELAQGDYDLEISVGSTRSNRVLIAVGSGNAERSAQGAPARAPEDEP
ncbi:MAG TPA: hypothetical protein VN428_03325 [Bryobacteraceae bacterium]|nr:hypothetical protein [Bryobacteraceae bacterium]